MKTDFTAQVLARLRSADRAWHQQRATVLLLQYWKWLVLAVALLLVADILLHLDARQRLMLGVGFIVALVAAGLWLLHCAWWRTSPLERVARLLETRCPELGSKLINLLHLREKFLTEPHQSALTRALAEQAVDDAAKEANQVPFLPLTKEPGMKRLAWHALIPSALFVLLAAVFAVPFIMTLERYLDPLGDHPPFSLTRLWMAEPSPANASVLYGRTFVVKARWSGHDPKELFLTGHPPGRPDQAFTVPMMPQEPGLFAQHLENVRTELLLHVHTRNRWSVSPVSRLAVVLTPQYEQATLAVIPPAYTGLPEKSSTFTFNGATALKGTKVAFTLRSNRPLKEGRLQLATASGPPQIIALKTVDPAKANEVTGAFIAEASGRMTFGLVDVDGIPSDEVKTSSFTVTHDLAPTVAIAEPAQDGFLVEGYRINARATASDDYGVKLLRVHLMRNDSAEQPVERRFDKVTRSEAIDVPLQDRFFPPLRAGDVVSLFAEGMDSHPSPPHVSRSEVRKLVVIGREDYNDLLRREHTIADLEAKYEDLFEDFRKLLAQQEALSKTAAALDKKLQEKPDDAAAQQQRDALRQTQEKLNKELLSFADNLEKFVSDMPLYDVEKDFQQQLAEQAAGIRQSVAQNQQDLQSPESKMSQAAQEHHDRMAGAQEKSESQIEKAIAEAAELQELMNNFSRFEELFHQQEQVSQQAMAYRDKAPLDETDQAAVQSLGAGQRDIGEQLRELEAKLGADAVKHAAKFPKASNSCRQLAAAMSDARMDYLASQASGKMMKGDGKGGHDGAERLREAMAALFGECNGGQQNASNELDTCLSLNHCKNPGNTAKQMAMSRKFGQGRSMNGQGAGMGGMRSGDTASGGAAVYGMESKLGRVNNGPGEGETPPSPGAPSQPVVTSSAVNQDPAQVSRATDAVPAATVLEQYRSLTDAYFDRITGKKKEEKP